MIYFASYGLRTSDRHKIASLLAALLVASTASCNSRRVSRANVDEMIKNHLQTGVKVAEVIQFLDSQKIKHFGYEEGPEPVFAPSQMQPSPEFRKYILAKISNVRETALASWDLYVASLGEEGHA